MEKIRRLSIYFQLCFIIVLIALPVLYVYEHLNNLFFVFPTQKGMISIPLGLKGQKVLAILDFPPLLIKLFIAVCFYKLFNLYGNGKLFVPESAKFIKRVGISLLALLILQPISQCIMSSVLSSPSDKQMFLFSISPAQVGIAITAAMLILLAWIMNEAKGIKEENERFI